MLQHAVPTTFGLKAAGWLVAVLDARARVLPERARDRLAAQLGGAAGTLSGLGERGLEVSALFARELGLAEPTLPWHTNRVRVAELGAALALACGVASKIGLDLQLLAQTEVGEVRVGGRAAAARRRCPTSGTPSEAMWARAAAELAARACVRPDRSARRGARAGAAAPGRPSGTRCRARSRRRAALPPRSAQRLDEPRGRPEPHAGEPRPDGRRGSSSERLALVLAGAARAHRGAHARPRRVPARFGDGGTLADALAGSDTGLSADGARRGARPGDVPRLGRGARRPGARPLHERREST